MSDDRRRLERNLTGVGCPTGKRTYATRKVAKEGASWAARTGAPGMRPYQCLECDQWHLGHKPQAVIRGEVSAREFYAPRTAPVPAKEETR